MIPCKSCVRDENFNVQTNILFLERTLRVNALTKDKDLSGNGWRTEFHRAFLKDLSYLINLPKQQVSSSSFFSSACDVVPVLLAAKRNWQMHVLGIINGGDNLISGALPSEIGLISGLYLLHLPGNELSSSLPSLPSEIGLCTSLLCSHALRQSSRRHLALGIVQTQEAHRHWPE